MVWSGVNYGTLSLAVAVMFVGLLAWDVGMAALPDRLPTSESADQSAIQVAVTELPQDRLTRDAVYMGAMTFAGLALFSSTLLTRVRRLDIKKRRNAAYLVCAGSFWLAIIHLGLAARMCCNDPGQFIWWLVFISFVLVLMVTISYLYLTLTDPSKTPERD